MRAKLTLCLCVVACLMAAALPAKAAPPPLIDRTQFFADPEISDAQVSPDGRLLAFVKPIASTRNIWVKQIDEPFEKARPLTTAVGDAPQGLRWSRDSRYILFTQDHGGNVKFNLYAVGVEDKTVRNLTDGITGSVEIVTLPEKAPDKVYVGLNDRDPSWGDLYSVQISTAKRELVRKNDYRIVQWRFDRDGNLKLVRRLLENGDIELDRVNQTGYTPLYTCSVTDTCWPTQFDPDGKRIYMGSNRGSDLIRLVTLDVQSGREDVVASDPAGRYDSENTMFSSRTGALVATVFGDGTQPHYVWWDKQAEADFAWLQRKLPGKVLKFTADADDGKWLVEALSDTEPGETYLFNRRTKALAFQYRLFPSLPRLALAHTSEIQYPSSDGVAIPAYLTLPKGVPPKTLPLLVMPHDGPWLRDYWGYSAMAQFFANRGFAVLQPNFRGSTGFGKKFLNGANRQWGELAQDDITWGVKHLVQDGTADPRRVVMFGMSYGGYAAMAGAAFTPDLYAAAVAMSGPSDLVAVVKSLSEFSGPARGMFLERIGDPTTPEGLAKLQKQSPINALENIKIPMMIIEGANDPLIKQAETDEIVAALRKRGMPVTYLLAKDEGHTTIHQIGPSHAWARSVNNLAVFVAAERFFGGIVGTCVQSTVEPEVEQRLKELIISAK